VRERHELRDRLDLAFARLTVDALVERLERQSVPCGRVRSVGEAIADPQVAARNMLLPIDVPGHGGFRVLGNPVKLSAQTPPAPTAPPRLGEHTGAVLASLGYTADQIDAIVHANVTA